MPVLQAMFSGESTPNHDDLFVALEYLWNYAHPYGPAFNTVFKHVGKDFAPGIEAARRNKLNFTRPQDDFFHFMGKESEMSSRCNVVTQLPNGKKKKTNLEWARSVLYAVQPRGTVDALDEIWAGYLLRLVCKDEVTLAMYFYHEYSEIIPISTFHEMNVFPNAQNKDLLALPGNKNKNNSYLYIF